LTICRIRTLYQCVDLVHQHLRFDGRNGRIGSRQLLVCFQILDNQQIEFFVFRLR
jgi:hypothetical protein